MNFVDQYMQMNALKRHFSSSYDYHKYNGKIKVNEKSMKRIYNRLQYYFKKINSSIENKEWFFISNLLENKFWNPTNSLPDFSQHYENYNKYRSYLESFKYRYAEDLKKLGNIENAILDVKENQHSPLMREYLADNINIITLTVLFDILPECKKYYDGVYSNDSVWKDINFLMKKLKPFLSYSKKDVKNLTKKILHESAETYASETK